MDCPVCKTDRLRRYELKGNLPASRCEQCGGTWVSAAQYWKWLRSHKRDTPEPSEKGMPLPVEEEGQAKLCPECGRLLRRWKIWPDTPFYLDRCGHCTSVWFDGGEWSAIESRGLQDQIHLFFSDIWQEELREEEMRRRFEKMYQERFGDADYARIKEIRAWLEEHPQRGALLAYLTDKDPYKAVSR